MRQAALALFLACCAQACSPDAVEPVLEHHWLRLSDADSLHYATAGSGADTIVVLSGGPGWSSSYLHPPLAGAGKRHGVIFLDLRGRGRSSPVHDSLSISLEADLQDLAALQSALHIGRMVLTGHGYGAGLAAMYAARHRDRVTSLILLSPMFTHVNLVWQGSFQPNDSVATSRYLVARRLGRDTVDAAGFCREFWGFDLSPVEETDSVVINHQSGSICDAAPANLKTMGTVSRAIRRSLGSWDWRDSLTRIQTPALIVQGDGNLFLQRTAQLWSESLPNASFVTVSGSPHFPWISDARRVENSLHTFLSSSRSSASQSSLPARDKAVTAVQR